MSKLIPNEIFNAVPAQSASSSDDVRVTDYIKSIAYRLPNCSDIMMEREFWNSACEFADRSCALRERQTGTLDANKRLTIQTPRYGELQRFVGAGISGSAVSVSSVSFGDGTATFSGGSSGGSAYVDYSVSPDVNASHDKTPTVSGGSTTYPNDKWILPRWFIKEYDRLLIAGTMFRLLGMSGRAWTDFNGARSNALVYNREINRISHGLITSGMRKQMLIGSETPFIGNAQQAATQTTTSTVQ